MQLKKMLLGGVLFSALAGAAGYGGALFLVGKEAHEKETKQEAKVEAAPAVLNLGQFTIPIFEGDSVRGVLLAQINIETDGIQQMQSLSRNKARIRSLVIDSFFAMEKEGLIAPEALSASNVSERLKKDLALAYESAKIRAVLIDRLLIQENGRAAHQPQKS
ncbi:hypothetical protein [Hyphococcus sp.]|jgi:flagellar basal body-associated protein FliL|uniref:hypothetical protein n=1 Tax=Hyphococcus sp. TaxID=2038636 RepID=UPI003D0DACBE